MCCSVRYRRPSSPCSGSHLCQDILALPGEQVLESIKGDVVGHAKGRAGGVTHMVRAVPLPVPADTRKSKPVLLVCT